MSRTTLKLLGSNSGERVNEICDGVVLASC